MRPPGPNSRQQQRVVGTWVLQVQLVRHAGRHSINRIQQHAQGYKEGEAGGRLELREDLQMQIR